MCGIVGYVGAKNASTIVFEGLKKLEYRGYDSAGIASVNGRLEIRRAEGKLVNLEQKLKEAPLLGQIAIGHTRWATHGAPIERNAHPHVDETGNIAYRIYGEMTVPMYLDRFFAEQLNVSETTIKRKLTGHGLSVAML